MRSSSSASWLIWGCGLPLRINVFSPRVCRCSKRARPPWTINSSGGVSPVRSWRWRSLAISSSGVMNAVSNSSGSAVPPRSEICRAISDMNNGVGWPLNRYISLKRCARMSLAVSLACRGKRGLMTVCIISGQPWRIQDRVPSKSNTTCVALGRGANEGSSSILSWVGALDTPTVKSGCDKKTSLHRESA